MANFTPIVDGLDWQSVAFQNEFMLAWKERWEACNFTFNGGDQVRAWANRPQLIVAGDDIQSVGEDNWNWWSLFAHQPAQHHWNWMQKWIDVECVKWINHSLVPAGLTGFVPQFEGSGINELRFTLADFRELAGLDPLGWRACFDYWNPNVDDWTDLGDPMWNTLGTRPLNGFRRMDDNGGDIIGPWIFDDLQKAFSTLKWLGKFNWAKDGVRPLEDAWTNVEYLSCDQAVGGCDPSRTAAVADWAKGWTNLAGADWGTADFPMQRRYQSGGGQRWSCVRARGNPYWSGFDLVNGLTYDWEAALVFYPFFGGAFNDLYGLGHVANTFKTWDTGVGDVNPNITANLFGDDPAQTFAGDYAPALNCPLGTTFEGLNGGSSAFLIKWNFTNTL